MNAYSEMYLYDAMRTLAEAFDYAVNCCNLTVSQFVQLFITTGISSQFGAGNPKYVCGMSGAELVLCTAERAGLSVDPQLIRVDYNRSSYYWTGWVLAYYQWKSGRTFREIEAYLPVSQIEACYNIMHEASEDKFADMAEEQRRNKTGKSQIQMYRRLKGYSQSMLAAASGVNLRTLQQYELRSKDINKASASTVLALSHALGCNAEDIMEH